MLDVDRLVNAKAAAALLDVSLAGFYKRVADATLPPPIKIGASARWRLSDLDAIVDELAAKRYQDAPKPVAEPVAKVMPTPRVRTRLRVAA